MAITAIFSVVWLDFKGQDKMIVQTLMKYIHVNVWDILKQLLYKKFERKIMLVCTITYYR